MEERLLEVLVGAIIGVGLTSIWIMVKADNSYKTDHKCCDYEEEEG